MNHNNNCTQILIIQELKQKLEHLQDRMWELKAEMDVEKSKINGLNKNMEEIKAQIHEGFSNINTLILKVFGGLTGILLTIIGVLLYNFVINKQ